MRQILAALMGDGFSHGSWRPIEVKVLLQTPSSPLYMAALATKKTEPKGGNKPPEKPPKPAPSKGGKKDKKAKKQTKQPKKKKDAGDDSPGDATTESRGGGGDSPSDSQSPAR